MRVELLTVERLLGRSLSGAERLNAPRVLHYAGVLGIPLPGPRVSVVGTRNSQHPQRAYEVASALAKRGFLVVSGLARGVDTLAHRAALDAGGRTVAVLGTPIDRFYPPENRELQMLLMREQAVLSQFPRGYPVRPSNFVRRNLTMALISDATVVVEAGEHSGVVHQCRECVRLGRPFFIHESMEGLSWVEALRSSPVLNFFSDAEELAEALASMAPEGGGRKPLS